MKRTTIYATRARAEACKGETSRVTHRNTHEVAAVFFNILGANVFASYKMLADISSSCQCILVLVIRTTLDGFICVSLLSILGMNSYH
ncbi:unnamed protein product [Haemonchus placei]|uniref:Uncharacterized protein n=1 Tax=Haemonchus placei TaxID=6290 RepID=A0A3P7TNR1_HAEPC|nr:unnamed protein product [Haemonchus placei]